MRFKISLEVLSQVSGNVLPISYQQQLVLAFESLVTASKDDYAAWLSDNGLALSDCQSFAPFMVSNLYVPSIHVIEDRLHINVPRIQFWASFVAENGTRELLDKCVLDKTFSIGDMRSAVSFKVTSIDTISPIEYKDTMDYQSLSPISVKAIRPNGTLEYLNPGNPYFAEFLMDGIIERWELFHKCQYTGSRDYNFKLLAPERRKGVTINADTAQQKKEVGYMIKFQLEMDPELQQFAYVCGIGDEIANGFGYIELLRKQK